MLTGWSRAEVRALRPDEALAELDAAVRLKRQVRG